MGAAINNKSTTTSSPLNNQKHPKPLGWGLNTFYWYRIFAIDYVVVKAQKLLSSNEGFLKYAMYHHRETQSN